MYTVCISCVTDNEVSDMDMCELHPSYDLESAEMCRSKTLELFHSICPSIQSEIRTFRLWLGLSGALLLG